MADKSKKANKGYVTEEGVSSLLERYPANTVLALLREVSQVAGEKIDWHEMVNNTATGISNAREYQMLWRHLAYCQTLDDQIDSDQDPMDDDSDLEFELEAFPPVGREALLEAAACVRVLMASGRSNDSHLSNSSTIDAPLSITLPNNKTFTIPVSLQRVPSSSGLAGEKRPINEITGVNGQPKRKRRGWSMEEDLKLTAAANKNVDLNWSNIARVEFNDERRANELSQRWATLKKKQGTLKVGTNSQQPDQLAAAHRAMSMALDMPKSDILKAASGGPKSQQTLGRSGPPKAQAQIKRPPMNPTPDPMVKAAAVAAGTRIASSADASSLLEAAHSQNVVHITTGGSSSMRPTSITSQLPSNVHFIRNGLAKAPISTYSAKPVVQTGSTTVQKSDEDGVVSTLGNASKKVIKQSQVAPRGGSTQVERVYERKVERHVNLAIRVEDDQVPLPSSDVKDNGGKNAGKNADNGPGSKVVDENKGGEGGLPRRH